MKRKDYFYLAKISLNSEKNKKNNIIYSLSFSMILLISFVFLILAFYVGSLDKMNSIQSISSIDIKLTDLNKEQSILNEITGISDEISYEYYPILTKTFKSDDNSILKTYNTIYIGDLEIDITYPIVPKKIDINSRTITNNLFYGSNPNSVDNFKFFDLNKSIIFDCEADYMKENKYDYCILGEVIKNDNEIMLSSRDLEILGLNASDVIGKSISYKTVLQDSTYAIDNNGDFFSEDNNNSLDGKEVYIFKDYIIVGIFNSDIYNVPSREISIKQSENGLEFWLSKNALYDNGSRIVPEYRYKLINDENKKVYFYETSPLEYSNDIIANGKVFLPYGLNLGTDSPFFEDSLHEIVLFKNFSYAYDGYKTVINIIDAYNNSGITITNSILYSYIDIYPFIVGVTISFDFIGGLILFITILNLLNTFKYSITSKKRFIGIEKALGLDGKKISYIYYCEMLLILLKSAIFSLIISFMLCFAIQLYFEYSTSTMYDSISNIIGLSLNYYPIAFLLVLLHMIIFVFIINKILCNKMVKNNIIDLLER
ncbi:MAG: FtsX-like permease family protein [Anaeroplasma sp.]